jgi:hypothetical protein
MRTFAYECYADEDVFYFLRDGCKLPIERLHGYGQGEVVNELLVRRRANLGMVDEDPLTTHHPLRDRMQVVSTTNDLELRKRDDRHLIIVKPDLENCFLRGARIARLESALPTRPQDLRRVLGIPDHPIHQVFRQELNTLHQESKKRGMQTFVTELESMLRGLL